MKKSKIKEEIELIKSNIENLIKLLNEKINPANEQSIIEHTNSFKKLSDDIAEFWRIVKEKLRNDTSDFNQYRIEAEEKYKKIEKLLIEQNKTIESMSKAISKLISKKQ